jgi:hypothetical protein
MLVVSLFEKFVFPSLSSPLQPLKENALYCVALLSVNDLAFGQTNFHLIVSRAISSLKGKSLEIAFQFLFDWILVHGLDVLEPNDVFFFKLEKQCNRSNLFWT